MDIEDRSRLQLRLPNDCKAFIERQARHNVSSQNAEIVRCIRERMKSEAATGAEFADRTPATAES